MQNCKIAETIENEIPKAKNQFSYYLKKTNGSLLFIGPTTSEEIVSQIKDLKNHKATKPNSIPTTIFKNFQKNISVPLTELIKFPAVLEIARVTPTFKKGDRLDVNNYRPISLTLNISKIIKKLIHKRLLFWNKTISFSHLSLVLETNTQQHMYLLKYQTKLRKPVIAICMPVVFILI